ncbi:hypothetical protein D3C74_241570 [compost metagenome]
MAKDKLKKLRDTLDALNDNLNANYMVRNTESERLGYIAEFVDNIENHILLIDDITDEVNGMLEHIEELEKVDE